MAFFVYILLCNDQTYYVGHTDNLEERIGQHISGNYCRYTAKRLPFTVVFVQDFATRSEALEMERRIKKWRRDKKEALINQSWEKLRLLSKKSFQK